MGEDTSTEKGETEITHVAPSKCTGKCVQIRVEVENEEPKITDMGGDCSGLNEGNMKEALILQ